MEFVSGFVAVAGDSGRPPAARAVELVCRGLTESDLPAQRAENASDYLNL